MTRPFRLATPLLLAGSMLISFVGERARAEVPQAAARPMDLLPLLEVRRDASPADGPSPVGGYVRFWVERIEPIQIEPIPADGVRLDGHDGSRDYRDERRTWLSRLLVGRSRSRILQAKITLANPNISASYTLASTTQISNRTDGEGFTSELGQRRFLTPYVRLDPGTTVGIEVALTASATVNPDITSNILSVIQRGARLATPTGSLVTSLNADRLRETANFIDQSIANLFGEKLSERSLTDFSADQWPALPATRAQGSTLATITAIFPMGGTLWSEGRNRPVGTWQIRSSEPIVSAFSIVPLLPATEPTGDSCTQAAGLGSLMERQACRAFIGLAPSTVFGFRVGENVTLGDALRGDAGITSAVARYRDSADENVAAMALCNLVAGRAEALGLNRFDAAAAVWAFAALGDLKPTIAFKMLGGVCLAGQLAHRLGLAIPDPSATPPATASAKHG